MQEMRKNIRDLTEEKPIAREKKNRKERKGRNQLNPSENPDLQPPPDNNDQNPQYYPNRIPPLPGEDIPRLPRYDRNRNRPMNETPRERMERLRRERDLLRKRLNQMDEEIQQEEKDLNSDNHPPKN